MNESKKALLGLIFGVVLIVLFSSPFVQSLALIGSLDVIAISALLGGTILLLSFFPRPLSLVLVACLVALVTGYNVGSGVYYSHQQNYLVYSSLYLLPEVVSVWQAMNGMQQTIIWVVGLAIVLFISLLTNWVKTVSISRRAGLSLSLFVFFCVSHIVHVSFASNQFNRMVFENQPIGYLLRSSGYLPFVRLDFEQSLARERVRVVARLRHDSSARLPARFDSSRLALQKGRRFGPPLADSLNQAGIDQLVYSKRARYPDHNVIMVIMESVRASESGVYGATVSATPFLDSLARESLIAQQFYANSGFTVKSEHAINCSMIDFMQGRPSAERNNGEAQACLPHLLREQGYKTHWFHGNTSEFYNRAEYLPRIGYQYIHSRAELDPGNQASYLGWGIADPNFFDLVLDQLDETPAPFLATILTVSNHLPFDFDWGIDFPDHLQKRHSYFQRYRRGIYYTDKAVEQFFGRFKRSKFADNTLLVVTGDHGIWTFSDDDQTRAQVSSSNSTLTKNEQYYRQPLFINTPDSASGFFVDRRHSHLDVAPTVLDLLGIQSPDTFMGLSMLVPGAKERLIYLASTTGLSMRREQLACIPSLQCSNRVDCYRDFEGVVPDVQCYSHLPGQDLLLDQSVVFDEFDREQYLRDRALFDYAQIILEAGHRTTERVKLTQSGNP